jgi:hypothetical protein
LILQLGETLKKYSANKIKSWKEAVQTDGWKVDDFKQKLDDSQLESDHELKASLDGLPTIQRQEFLQLLEEAWVRQSVVCQRFTFA